MDELTRQRHSAERPSVGGRILDAQRQVCTAANAAMVTAYWKSGENDRTAYGKQVLQYISERMTEKFGIGFHLRNLRYMRQFYLTFPNVNALRSELSWTHYRSLMKVNDTEARNFYMEEAVKAGRNLSAGFEDERGEASAHNPKVRFNEDVCAIGPACLAHCAMR